jgi:hypothetical protein
VHDPGLFSVRGISTEDETNPLIAEVHLLYAVC